MFTVAQIKAAHSKVKSRADFPAYIKEIKTLALRNIVGNVKINTFWKFTIFTR